MKAGGCRRWGNSDLGSSVLQALKGAALLAVVVTLAGCAGAGEAARALNPDPPRRCTPTPKRCSKGKFDDAAKKFEDLDREHPYSPEARRAIVMAAYAYYKAGKMPEAIASAERYTTHASRHQGRPARAPHHRVGQLRRDKSPTAIRRRRARRSSSSRRSSALSGQHLRAAGRQPIRLCRGHARGRGDERRPLLPGQEQPRRRHQSLQDGGHRVPDDGARRRGAVPADGANMALGIAPRRRPPPPCSGTTSPTRSGTRTPTRCCRRRA